MECLKLLQDLQVLSGQFEISILNHLFRYFDITDKNYQSVITHFHLLDYESAEFRSAYHNFCDWFYGWNIAEIDTTGKQTSADKDVLNEVNVNFPDLAMNRVARVINIDDEFERNEATKIVRTFMNLFNTNRRLLKKHELQLEEKLGSTKEVSDVSEHSGTDSGHDTDADEVEKSSSDTTPVRAQFESDEDMKEEPESVEQPEAFNTHAISLLRNDKVHSQAQITSIYNSLDHVVNYTLLCVSNCLMVLSFTELLREKDEFARFLSYSNEIATEFVSNPLRAFVEILNSELNAQPQKLDAESSTVTDKVTLDDVRDPLNFKDILAQVNRLNGQKAKNRVKRLHQKLYLLHFLFSGVDVFVFPKSLKTHK